MMSKKKALRRAYLWAISGVLSLVTGMLHAAVLPLPPDGQDVIGHVIYAQAQGGETLVDIAEANSVGMDEVQRVNPHINPKQRIATGTKILIPGQFILPPGPREGIVINLAELRLYYYPAGQNVVLTEPVGIGREGGWQTPTGSTTVTSKHEDPPWRPTANVRAEAARNGTPIPEYFPPGPNNPLGKHSLRLGWPTYLIHGTNRSDGVGSRTSAGCIRMYPEGVERLHSMAAVGTTVRVINEPFKVGWLNGQLYFEAHNPLSEQQELYEADMSAVVNIIHQASQNQNTVIKWSVAQEAAQNLVGIPVVVN